MIFSNFADNYNHLKIMKKSESTSRKETPEEELKRLRKENKSLKASKATLKASKEKLKAEKKALKAELKKKDVTTITLTKEQSELLSTLFPDIDIHSL